MLEIGTLYTILHPVKVRIVKFVYVDGIIAGDLGIFRGDDEVGMATWPIQRRQTIRKTFIQSFGKEETQNRSHYS